MNYIYELFDPIHKVIFYIGRSKQPPNRFEAHLGDGIRFPQRKRDWRLKDRWINDLQENHQTNPEMRVIEQIPDSEAPHLREMFWVLDRLAEGCPLTNISFIGTDHWGVSAKTAKHLARQNLLLWANKEQRCSLTLWILNRWDKARKKS